MAAAFKGMCLVSRCCLTVLMITVWMASLSVTVNSDLTYAKTLTFGDDKGNHLLVRRDVSLAENTTKGDTNGYDVKNDTKSQLMEKYKTTQWYKEDPDFKPTMCIHINKTDNNTIEGHFLCPMTNESREQTKCCGEQDKQFCCKPEVKGGRKPPAHDETTMLLMLIPLFLIPISLCLVLYCCCCQRRPEVHSGKLVWIRKSNKKEIYMAEGGINPPEQPDTELIGFTERVDGPNGTDHSHHGSSNDITKSEDAEEEGTKTHVAHSGQEMTVPLINIQASTPVVVSEEEEDILVQALLENVCGHPRLKRPVKPNIMISVTSQPDSVFWGMIHLTEDIIIIRGISTAFGNRTFASQNANLHRKL
ncbi:uncharacterized protein LOC132552053 [Ylistrum balloti]|uniref:uncharacterized protein LOC132552053 n=1 Tax=Ylistrum balloti TaxID=509963 RepID=UPI002905B8F1|nr:uncharacterized protein LOC132552053 [Ylistrum balloti]